MHAECRPFSRDESSSLEAREEFPGNRLAPYARSPSSKLQAISRQYTRLTLTMYDCQKFSIESDENVESSSNLVARSERGTPLTVPRQLILPGTRKLQLPSRILR